jgi:hypothetical protein
MLFSAINYLAVYFMITVRKKDLQCQKGLFIYAYKLNFHVTVFRFEIRRKTNQPYNIQPSINQLTTFGLSATVLMHCCCMNIL